MMQKQRTIVEEKQQLTELQSQTFVRNMLRASFSCILYLRGIFDESHFTEKDLWGSYYIDLTYLPNDFMSLRAEKISKFMQPMLTAPQKGVRVKALLPASPQATSLTEWMESGVFDALQRKYLKSIVLSIYSDSNCEDTLIESYHFFIQYRGIPQLLIDKGEQVEYDLEESNELETVEPTREQIKESTILMIRRLLVLTETLNPLPQAKHMVLKLLYHSNVTPDDYRPKNFETKFAQVDEEAPMDQLILGKVSTPHHSLNCLIRTLPQQVCRGVSEDPWRMETGEISVQSDSQATDEEEMESSGSSTSQLSIQSSSESLRKRIWLSYVKKHLIPNTWITGKAISNMLNTMGVPVSYVSTAAMIRQMQQEGLISKESGGRGMASR